MRPDFRHIEDIPPIVFCLLRGHDLHVNVPEGAIALLNSLKEILDQEVRVLSSDLGRLVHGKILDALSSLDMYLHVFEGAVLYCEFSLILVRIKMNPVNEVLALRVNLYVCPLYAFICRNEAGVPRSLNKCMI